MLSQSSLLGTPLVRLLINLITTPAILRCLTNIGDKNPVFHLPNGRNSTVTNTLNTTSLLLDYLHTCFTMDLTIFLTALEQFNLNKWFSIGVLHKIINSSSLILLVIPIVKISIPFSFMRWALSCTNSIPVLLYPSVTTTATFFTSVSGNTILNSVTILAENGYEIWSFWS